MPSFGGFGLEELSVMRLMLGPTYSNLDTDHGISYELVELMRLCHVYCQIITCK
jgi:hypothetical protein